MPRIADFVVIQDHGVKLPRQISGGHTSESISIQFDAPGALVPAILSFRLLVENGTPNFLVELNGTELFSDRVEAGPERTWHEVISQLPLRAQDNALRIVAFDRNGATVTVSDIYVLFQVQIP